MFLLPIKPVHILIAGEDESSIQLGKMTQFMQPSSTDSTEVRILTSQFDYIHYLFEPKYQEILDQMTTSLNWKIAQNLWDVTTENVTIAEDSASLGYINDFESLWFGDSDDSSPLEDTGDLVPEWETLYDDRAPFRYSPPSSFPDWGSIRIEAQQQVFLDRNWETEESW